MRLSDAQRTVFRLTAVAMLVMALPLALGALLVDSRPPTSEAVTIVDDPASFALPDAGPLKGWVVVYGVADDPAVSARDLGCALVSDDGDELNQAQLSHLKVLLHHIPSVTVADVELQPLFEVSPYPSGARIECTDAAAASPLAVSEPSTFGSAALLVRVMMGVGALLFVGVGVIGLALTRPRRI